MRDLAGMVFAAILDFKWLIMALVVGALVLNRCI
jgi:hypothetical protein